MILHRLGLINKNQRGYTLIELIVALAIIGFITGGIATTIFQVIIIEALTSNHMTAVRQVQNAGYWISHDTQMSQEDPVIVNNSGQLESITLTWSNEWDSNTYEAIYDLNEDNELNRSYKVNDGDTTETLVAQYIDTDPTKTKCDFTDGVLTLTVTATVGGGWLEGHETRVYEVTPRPDEIYH